ncbi:rhodanese-like domain-containing protein [uncultured Enterococcus sp.]|uniref:rhodanese-like domain-containing protein n=1 Tax=uncultured Enterococcus sp. TaxID=167972 RepID=UPI00261FE868|nr:rhodanese-like domain-containing protein [uncultured Enterococcus sp.]
MSTTLFWINIILVAIILAMILNWAYYKYMAKRFATVLEEEAFKEGMRKAQIIDVREKNEFDSGHILGARSIPYPMLMQSLASIRKDQPVYLYDTRTALSTRAAKKLRKNGYDKDKIFILKDGFEGWTGKTKGKKYE